MSTLTRLFQHRCFAGTMCSWSYPSPACKAPVRFAVFIPPQAAYGPVPVVYFLSGLTCTEENFMLKSGVQRYAAEYGLMIVTPDTSPRHTGTPGEDDQTDLGTGASFYLNATAEPWAKHYQMYSFVVDELPPLIEANFPADPERRSIFGHSMGGHGALVCALRNPTRYKSVSAFSPIVAPSQVPWGQKAFRNYLGEDQTAWAEYDACALVRRQPLSHRILIDQGTADQFLVPQLRPHLFEQACQEVGQPVTIRLQEGYDHSFFFISTFVGEHLKHHAEALGVL